MRFGKAVRLTRRGEFLRVQARGRKLHAEAYVVIALANQFGHARLGVTVSSRVGGAVVRNRVKRWVREAFRALAAALPPLDLVVIARGGAVAGGLPAARRAVGAAVGPASGAPARGGTP